MQSIDILRCSMANEPETIVKLQRLQVQQRPIIYWDRSHSRTAFFKKRSEVPGSICQATSRETNGGFRKAALQCVTSPPISAKSHDFKDNLVISSKPNFRCGTESRQVGL